MTDTLKHYETQWQREHDRCQELERESAALAEELRLVKKQLREQDGHHSELQQALSDTHKKLKASQALVTEPDRLEELQRSLLTPQDWTDEFIVPFVEELESFDLLSELQNNRSSTKPTDWCSQLTKQISDLEESYNIDQAQTAKKVLMALWVYVQWSELVHGK